MIVGGGISVEEEGTRGRPCSPSRMNGPNGRGSSPNRPPRATLDPQTCPYPYRKIDLSGWTLLLYLIRTSREAKRSRGFPQAEANSSPVPRATQKRSACDYFFHKPSSPRQTGLYRLLASLIQRPLVKSFFTSSPFNALPYLIRVGV